ncbi:MAG: enoyl-CoA hydratase/isomerase family protein [Gammaproteobacteria bacterium]|nr:enoyl-CoA hydratase/isomerase family protein [Gammaproteobacteria bacterium]
MSFDTILTETSDGLLTITLNRPDRLNAWTYKMGAELGEAIAAANADDGIEAIVVTGAGRGFCAGADIADVFQAQQEDQQKSDGAASERPIMRNWVELVRESKPLVAAINGACIGVGLTQVLPMDYLIASRDAKLSLRFIKMGLVPELASSQYVTLRCGFGVANELMLTGKTVSGEEAAAIRLVDRAVDADDLMPAAREMAKAMGSNPQSALRAVKQLITVNAAEADVAAVQRRELEALQRCYTSPEHKEAIAAFLAKREPDFRKARQSG